MLRELEILKPIAIMNPAWIIQSRGAYFDIKKFFAEKILSQIANDIVFASIFHFSKFAE